MKLFALLCVIGFAAANSNGPLNWQPGTTYNFEYEGRQITGFPEIGQQMTGVGIRCTVELTVGQDGRFGIRVQNPHYVRINEKLEARDETAEGSNWRNLVLPPFQEVPEEMKKQLASPVVLQLGEEGEFQSLQVSKDEPEWTVNFKKALASLFQTRFQGQSQQSEDTVESIYGVSEQSHGAQGAQGAQGVSFWQTKEESLDGTCDVSYQINEIPSYMTKDMPKIPDSEESTEAGQQYYEIIKSRDVGSCSRRTSFVYYKPGHFACPTGNCDGMWGRSSITRYIAYGTRNNLNIRRIINDGELTQSLLGYNTEKYLTGVRQDLNVTQHRRSGGPLEIQEPTNGVKIQNLLYQYIRHPEVESSKQPEQLVPQSELGESTSAYKNYPRNIQDTRGNKKFEQEKPKLVEQVKKIFGEIVNRDLNDIQDFPKRQVTMKILGLARAFSLLDRQTIQEDIYEQLKNQFTDEEKRQTFKNVFFDTLVMGGTPDVVSVIRELVQKNELNQFQAVSLFTVLPNYIMTPTKPVLNNLYNLIKSEQVRQNYQVYSHAVLGFTALLERACVADNRQTSYPSFVYGEFCNPDSEIISSYWIPYLQRELYQSESPERRNLFITALGLLSHKNVLPAIVPLVENNNNNRTEGRQDSNLPRTLAIYALGNVGRRYPELVTPLAFTVFNNQADNTEIRIAAFNLLLRQNPKLNMLQKIAETTWRETDDEVLRYVSTSLYSLGQQNDLNPMNEGPSVQNRRDSNSAPTGELQRNAALVYGLTKPVVGGFPSSAALYHSEYLQMLGVGNSGVSSWIASKDSMLPSNVYYRIYYYMDRYQFQPLEVAYRLRGADNVIQKIIDILSGKKTNEQTVEEQAKQQIHHEFREVIEKLRIKTRRDDSSDGALFLNFFENSPMFYNFQASSTEKLEEKIRKLLKNPSNLKDMIEGENRVNWQKTLDASPHEYNIPSDMGFPIIVEVHMPIVASLRGQIVSNVQDKLNPRFEINAHYLFASQLTGWVGTISPFTGEFVASAIDEHSVVTMPTQFNVKLNMKAGKLDVTMKADSRGNQPLDIFHFHVRPYNVAQSMWNLEPMNLNKDVKLIESGSPLVEKSYSFGQYLGLDLKAVIRTETPFVDVRSLVQKFQQYGYNPLNVLRFGWTAGAMRGNGLPSLRRHEVLLQYNPSSSSTKQISFHVEAHSASKKQDKPIKFHSIGTDESSNEYKIVSQTVEQHSTEQKQKIKESMEKEEIQSGNGVSVRLTAFLNGQTQHSAIDYTLNIVSGSQQSRSSEINQKWSVVLNNQRENQKVCLKGQVQLPSGSSPVWDMHKLRAQNWNFRYENRLGFGNEQCDASQVQLEGQSRASQQQKDFSKTSPEAKLLEKLTSKGEPAAKLSELKEKVRLQASRLDETDFVVRYINVPNSVLTASRWFNEGLKAAWWPNMVINPVNSAQGSNQGSNGLDSNSQTHKYRVVIRPETQTFDVDFTNAHEELKFKHIRIPSPVSYIFPLPAIQSSLRDVVSEAVTGRSSWYPKCEIEGKHVRTFDNKTAEVQPDNCFHLLSADCSAQKRFAVLIREDGSEQQKEIKLYLGKTEIQLTRNGGRIQMQVNGTRREMSQNAKTYITDRQGQQIAEAQLTEDNVLLLKSQLVNLKYNGKRTQVEVSGSLKDQLCGLCGDANGQKKADLRGPQKCVYSTQEVFAASYRVPLSGKPCRPLPQQVQQQLNQENEQCVKYQEVSSKVQKSFEAQAGDCTKYQHHTIVRRDQLCFSSKPIPECSARCQQDGSIEAEVKYTCMDKGRVAEHVAKKIREGQAMPELENLPEAFSRKMNLPRSCSPSSSSQGMQNMKFQQN